MKRICVFCGSASGVRPEYIVAASQLGALFAERRIDLVYGGCDGGLMGAVARSCLEAGGDVVGVVPQRIIDLGLVFEGLSRLCVVGTMHERKAMMASLADGFIALPGGLGTLDELFDVAALAQLGIHRKPCGILNVAGYFDPLLGFLDHAADEAFIPAIHRSLILADTCPHGLLAEMEARHEAKRGAGPERSRR